MMHSRLTIEEYESVRKILEDMIDGYRPPETSEASGYSTAYLIGHKSGYIKALKSAIHLIRAEG